MKIRPVRAKFSMRTHRHEEFISRLSQILRKAHKMAACLWVKEVGCYLSDRKLFFKLLLKIRIVRVIKSRRLRWGGARGACGGRERRVQGFGGET